MSTEPRPRVLILIPHLGGGGAEQVTLLLAQGFNPKKYELHLGLVTQAKSSLNALPPWVTVHALGAHRVRGGALALLRLVRQIKPNVILSGMAHLNFLVLLLRPFLPNGTRVIIRQNATVSASLASGALPIYTRLLYRLLYRHAERVICQTGAMAEDLGAELGLSAERIVVLPNPVDLDGIRSIHEDRIRWNGGGPHLLAVGRLSPEKGYDLLLEAMLTVRERFPSVDLTILGTGSQEAELEAQCRLLGLDAAVNFAGHVDRPSAYFAGATLFVLSSRHEGMPNALLEAAAAGVPLVALPASGGVCDLLSGLPGVWLAKEISAAALAGELLSALEGLQPGQRFAHAFIEEFRLEKVIAAYEALLDACLNAKTKGVSA
jgi:glycosyltransferase involved in cell wall biosynthesis